MTYVALVTGASSGIGEAIARRLATRDDTRLVLVARREERLRALADELGPARHPDRGYPTIIAVDLTADGAPALIAETIEREYGALHLLVNNAGARWSTGFGEGGWENVARHMRVNFDAPVRLTEALLPLLRRTAADAAAGPAAPVPGAGSFPTARPRDHISSPAAHNPPPPAIVNVCSTSGRVARRQVGGYCASKFALAGWSDALALEEAAHGVHVGLVMPGFIATEGFPQAELRAKPLTRWLVGDASVVVDAVLAAGPGGRREVYAPGYYKLLALLRFLAPRLLWRLMNRGTFTTTTYSS